ncbi:melanopsin isoform X2 [Atheta coriaria]|uniref:melanopsin isoform X2 n=1 Tax=Dalotia coriaria TaxID=877792 RepID=UPI0031F38DFD
MMMDVGALRQWLIATAFVLGSCGNVFALWILYKSAKTRNAKHVLMLRCLAVNDLVAQLGMLTLMVLPKMVSIPIYWMCVLFVMLRAFGLGSGCVALVMAIERWLALTRPFVYQQYVTKVFLGRTIFLLWVFAALLTYTPFFGFGLFYENGKCCRYRQATEVLDIVYAYLFLLFGTTLCFCIAYFNSQVFVALSRIGRKQEKVLIRRVSRAIITQNGVNHKNIPTTEELAFAKLMAFICIVFVACWMPQMISIPLTQFFPTSKFCAIFSRIADVLMCVYFMLDPYIYVLHQHVEKTRFRIGFTRQRSSENATTTPNNTPTTDLLEKPRFDVPETV